MKAAHYIEQQAAQYGITSYYLESVTVFVEEGQKHINAHNQLYFMFHLDSDHPFTIEAENSYFDAGEHLRYNLRELQHCFTGQMIIRTDTVEKQPFRFMRVTPKK